MNIAVPATTARPVNAVRATEPGVAGVDISRSISRSISTRLQDITLRQGRAEQREALQDVTQRYGSKIRRRILLEATTKQKPASPNALPLEVLGGMTLKPLRFPADRTSRTKKDPGRLLEQARFIYICREGIEGRQGEGRHREEYIYIRSR